MLIDVNVYLSRWPFRRLHGDETKTLVAKLRGEGVDQAWAGSFDALLHKDISAVNSRVTQECQQHGDGMLLPVGSINPKLPDWQEDVRRCWEDLGMKVLRVFPGYHGYNLEDEQFLSLCRLAEEQNLILQIVAKMEDERTQHPMVRAKVVDFTPFVKGLSLTPRLRVVVLNALKDVRQETLTALAGAGEVFFDIGMLEGVGGVSQMAARIGAGRLLFGSLYPLFYFESAALKMKESPLSMEEAEAIGHANARRLLG